MNKPTKRVRCRECLGCGDFIIPACPHTCTHGDQLGNCEQCYADGGYVSEKVTCEVCRGTGEVPESYYVTPDPMA